MSDISERIMQVIDYVGSNPNSFAKLLGYKRSQAIYDIIKGKANPSYDFFNKLMSTEISESISLRWLLSGKGSIGRKGHEINMASESQPHFGIHKHIETCPQCNLRERLIQSQEKTIAALETTLREVAQKKDDK